ncbi:hypothetical protein [Aphanothece sacrum]|uniref:Adenylate cyclase n=1 Tax=Aphanothece sacrum FPU1 TaxID=1920663 RepID=A0A401ICR6_APHSA|nr:hypothetical protein [Aphanothece sacrum]GBF79088.1 adenylate cyclase [Aphanothece sacrum FPU1]GBF85134.1 adenylate cyclase [Aphanothece sacrum FPU3]
MQLASESFEQTIQYLEQHEESLRIKKLIFCLCKKYWENDLNVLNSFSLADLITELLQNKPTSEQLTFSLYKLVKTLNRPKVYAGVSKVILEKLAHIYNPEAEPIEILTSVADNGKETQISDGDFLLEQAVRNLTNHQENGRISKLIYAVTQQYWENDLNRINNYGLKNLLLEIIEKYSTKGDLEIAFGKIVENINKKNLYVAICKIIFTQLEGLYDNLQENIESEQQVSESYQTQIIKITSEANTPQRYKEQQQSVSPFETAVIDITSEKMVTELKQIQAVPTSSAAPPKTYDIFEIRLEIMQYTNPLRAKILLFSLLFHPWDRSGQDWSMLRSYTLDDLLEQLIQSGRPITEIEAQLYGAARSLSDPEAHLQAASTIIETIKSVIS